MPAQTDKVPIEGGEIIVYAAELSARRPDDRRRSARRSPGARRPPTARSSSPLPTPGDYVVEINVESLPGGRPARRRERGAQLVERRCRRRASSARCCSTSPRRARPTVGAGRRSGDPFVRPGRPLCSSTGIKFGLIIGMCAIGLSLIYGTTGLVNFAHSEMITIGAVLTWWLNSRRDPPADRRAARDGARRRLVGAGLDVGLWRPLRRRGTGLVAMMIVSIGLAIALRYLILYLFGDRQSAVRRLRGGDRAAVHDRPGRREPRRTFVIIVISAACSSAVSDC